MTTPAPTRRKHRLPMSAPMIGAIQREIAQPGTGKTMTRRIDKDPARSRALNAQGFSAAPIQPGDLIAFTEAFAFGAGYDALPPREVPAEPYVQIWYRADGEAEHKHRGRWRHSMFMPYWATRYTGVVTDVRVERLQEISEDDAVAEGLQPMEYGTCPYVPTSGEKHRAAFRFRELWDSLHGPDSWAANPWLWVYSFQPLHTNVLDVSRAAW